MWRLKEKPKVCAVTLKTAIQFRDIPSVPNDRGLKKPIMEHLRKALRAGEARPFEIAVCWCEETGQFYRANGKHSCHSVAEYLEDDSLSPHHPVQFVISEYACDTLEDVAKLYATFDRKAQSRSPNDVYLAFAATDMQLASIGKKLVSLAVQGMTFAEWGESCYLAATPEDRAQLLLDHRPFAHFLKGLLCSEGKKKNRIRTPKHMQRAPVVAAMFTTYQIDPKKSGQFWELVRDESSYDSQAPDRILAAYLLRANVNMGQGAKKTKQGEAEKEISGRRAMFVKCLHAWNAWRRGTRTDLKYYPNAPIPKAI